MRLVPIRPSSPNDKQREAGALDRAKRDDDLTSGETGNGPRSVNTASTRRPSGSLATLSRVTWQRGTTIKRLRTSSSNPDSLKAARAALISSGTALNLFSGKKPACSGRAWTASGASSFSLLRRSVSSFLRPAPASVGRGFGGVHPEQGGEIVERGRRIENFDRRRVRQGGRSTASLMRRR